MVLRRKRKETTAPIDFKEVFMKTIIMRMVFIILAITAICSSLKVKPNGRRKIKRKGAESHPECQTFKKTNERRQCELVFSNPYIEWSEKMLSDDKYIENLETVDVSDNDGARITRIKRRAQKIKKCKFSMEHYKNTSLPKGLRSTSPYESYITFDANRIPVRIISHRCLCRGCINVATLEEDNNVVSQRVQVPVEVMRNKAKVRETVYVGCSCFIPKTFNIKNRPRGRPRNRKRRNRRTG
uniref:uncharacterized protein LOC120345004 n=1 Tax=Styela clava TaxID=7725 RepID=UPI00193A47B8|nr:uncharacterized protein LOC120345004 [Styela clava]